MPANYDAKCTETRRAARVDIDRELREFGIPEPVRSLSDRVKPATALMGYDPSRVDLEGYDWTAGG